MKPVAWGRSAQLHSPARVYIVSVMTEACHTVKHRPPDYRPISYLPIIHAAADAVLELGNANKLPLVTNIPLPRILWNRTIEQLHSIFGLTLWRPL